MFVIDNHKKNKNMIRRARAASTTTYQLTAKISPKTNFPMNSVLKGENEA
jgi:hypothetical protein